MFGVAAVQVAHPLAARLPPEVQEAVGDGVVLKHDVVHVSVFLGGERETSGSNRRAEVCLFETFDPQLDDMLCCLLIFSL